MAIMREETAESALGKSLGMLKVRLEGCVGVSPVRRKVGVLQAQGTVCETTLS